MFQNSVFQVSTDTKKWLKAAALRAVRTMAQTAAATIGTSAVMGDVNWALVGSASLLAGILSVLTAIAGLPEASAETETEAKTQAKTQTEAETEEEEP